MEYQDILFSIENHIAKITLNRPEAYNAISDSMRDSIRKAIDFINEPKNDIRIVVITGAGKAFCSGGDIKLMKERIDADVSYRERLETYRKDVACMVKDIKGIRQPVIAMINGAAYGAGCSIAMLCDIRIASEEAKFGMPFTKRGLIPDWGSTYFLPRLVGKSTAIDLAITGRSFSAKEALEIGFVNKILPKEELDAGLESYCKLILENGPGAVKAAKAAIDAALEAEMDTALERESHLQSECYRSLEHKEGVESFLEKRPPNF
ncbi:MAG: enoyl-CoA hydratase/isomerase family protein [Lachnospiraceae bacterium]